MMQLLNISAFMDRWFMHPPSQTKPLHLVEFWSSGGSNPLEADPKRVFSASILPEFEYCDEQNSFPQPESAVVYIRVLIRLNYQTAYSIESATYTTAHKLCRVKAQYPDPVRYLEHQNCGVLGDE